VNNAHINDGACSGDAVSFPRASNRICKLHWNLQEVSMR